MHTGKATARTLGALFIIATVAAALSVAVLNPLLDDPDYLLNLSADESGVVLGTLLDLVTAAAVIAIGVMFFPVLRQSSEGLALGYAAARIIEGAVIVVGALSSLLLLTLSQEFVQASALDAPGFQPLGDVLLAARDWTDILGTVIAFGVSAVILNFLLYKTRLVPRFLSVWGLAGAALLLVAGLLGLSGESPTATPMLLLALPIAVNEMVLALWLIIKGFNPSAATARPATG